MGYAGEEEEGRAALVPWVKWHAGCGAEPKPCPGDGHSGCKGCSYPQLPQPGAQQHREQRQGPSTAGGSGCPSFVGCKMWVTTSGALTEGTRGRSVPPRRPCEEEKWSRGMRGRLCAQSGPGERGSGRGRGGWGGGENRRLLSDIPAEPGAPRVGFRALFALPMRGAGTRSAARTRGQGVRGAARRGAAGAQPGGLFVPGGFSPLRSRPRPPPPPPPPPRRLSRCARAPRHRHTKASHRPLGSVPPGPGRAFGARRSTAPPSTSPRRPLAARLNKRQERR